MARFLKSILFLVILLRTISLLSKSDARPLIVTKPPAVSVKTRAEETFLDRLIVEGIKTGGPSQGGRGHVITNVQTQRIIVNSGPSQGGRGHVFTNSEAERAIVNSGPSPGGKGHEFTNSQTQGATINCGPIQGGRNAQTQRFAKNGPSPGEGH